MPRKATLVIACGSAIMFLTMGVRQSSGLFLGPVSSDLGLATQVFSLSLAFQNLLLGLAQPFTSAIADKWGTGRTIVVCGVLHIIGLLILSGADGPWDLHVGAGLFIGLASTGTTFAIILGVVARAVAPEKRSLAMGLAAAMASMGQLIMAPMNQELISRFGWSTTFFLLAILLGAIVPLAAALTGKAADTHEPLTATQTLPEALREAGGHPGFILLTIGFFVCGFQVMFIAIHFPNFLASQGKPEMAGLAMGLIGFTNFMGTLAFGWLGGKYSKKRLLSSIYFLRAVVFAVFLALPFSTASVLLFSASLGFLWLGTVPLTSALVGQIFGVRYVATLVGVVFMSHQLGSFTGAWLGGWLFDRTGNYDFMWLAAIALGLAAALIHLPINERSVRAGASGLSKGRAAG